MGRKSSGSMSYLKRVSVLRNISLMYLRRTLFFQYVWILGAYLSTRSPSSSTNSVLRISNLALKK